MTTETQLTNLILKRLLERRGTAMPVDVKPVKGQAHPACDGWMEERDGEILIRVYGGNPVAPVVAGVEMDLSTGQYGFVALLEPLDASTWRVGIRKPVDARRELRLPVALPARVAPAEGDITSPAMVIDLSATGVGIETRLFVEAGQPCRLLVDGEGGERLGTLVGRVVRRRGTPPLFRYGLRLESTPEQQATIYQQLLELMAPRLGGGERDNPATRP